MLDPRQFGDLGQQDYDHFGHLLVQTRLFLQQKLDQEVLDAQFLLHWYLAPILGEYLFQRRYSHKLRELGL